MNKPVLQTLVKIALLMERVVVLLEQRQQENTSQQNEWLDHADVMRRFHISESKLYRLKKENKLDSYRLGKKEYFLAAQLEQLLLTTTPQGKSN